MKFILRKRKQKKSRSQAINNNNYSYIPHTQTNNINKNNVYKPNINNFRVTEFTYEDPFSKIYKNNQNNRSYIENKNSLSSKKADKIVCDIINNFNISSSKKIKFDAEIYNPIVNKHRSQQIPCIINNYNNNLEQNISCVNTQQINKNNNSFNSYTDFNLYDKGINNLNKYTSINNLSQINKKENALKDVKNKKVNIYKNNLLNKYSKKLKKKNKIEYTLLSPLKNNDKTAIDNSIKKESLINKSISSKKLKNKISKKKNLLYNAKDTNNNSHCFKLSIEITKKNSITDEKNNNNINNKLKSSLLNNYNQTLINSRLFSISNTDVKVFDEFCKSLYNTNSIMTLNLQSIKITTDKLINLAKTIINRESIYSLSIDKCIINTKILDLYLTNKMHKYYDYFNNKINKLSILNFIDCLNNDKKINSFLTNITNTNSSKILNIKKNLIGVYNNSSNVVGQFLKLNCSLIALDLSFNVMCNQSVYKIIYNLNINYNNNLLHVDLSSNDIGIDGGKYIISYLLNYHCKIISINLKNNYLGPYCGKLFGSLMKKNNKSIQYINVDNNNINEKSIFLIIKSYLNNIKGNINFNKFICKLKKLNQSKIKELIKLIKIKNILSVFDINYNNYLSEFIN